MAAERGRSRRDRRATRERQRGEDDHADINTVSSATAMPTTASSIQRQDETPIDAASVAMAPATAGTGSPAASASAAVLDEREQQQRFGNDEEEQRRRQPDDGEGEGDERGAAQYAGHFAPSATGAAGDALIPP